MKKSILILTTVFLIVSALAADSLSFSLAHYATDNLFQNRFGVADQVSLMSFYLDKDLSKISFYTQGSYSHLYKNPDLAYYAQDVGMDYLQTLSEKSALYLSLAARGTFHRTEYSDFNYVSIGAFASFKTYLTPTSILKVNSVSEFKNYTSSLFDFVSQDLLFSLDKYFQTRTTVKGEVNWGVKYFLHPYVQAALIPQNSSPASPGKGNGGPGGPGRHGSQFQTVNSSEGRGEALQALSLGGLIAQGLGDSLGLRISASHQWILSGENPFSYIEEYYAVENPSYDRFSWAGYRLGAQLTVLIPWNLQLKIGYTTVRKEFPGIESLDLEGIPLGPTRLDTRNQYEARLEKAFPKLTVFLTYVNSGNRSNDLYFDWQGQFFSLGIDWSFPLGDGK